MRRFLTLTWTAALLIGVTPARAQDASCDTWPTIERGCAAATEQVTSASGEESHRSVSVELGVCHDVARCAARAEERCGRDRLAKVREAEIDPDGTQCSFSCSDKSRTRITCGESVDNLDLEMPESECEITEPPAEGCKVGEMSFFVAGAGDDRYITERDVTEREVMSLDQALELAQGYDGIAFPTVIANGTCSSVRNCGRRANEFCSAMNEGRALRARVSPKGRYCSHRCEGGARGDFTCRR